MIDKAFILAAGYGKRLLPYTEDRPKPLVTVAGRTLIDRILDHLGKTDTVQEVTVNLHYKGALLEGHLSHYEAPVIRFSQEDTLLDTGGGIKNALANFEGQDFYVLSGDALWTEGGGRPALQRLAEEWDPQRMDILILLQPVESMALTRGVGDYDLMPDGRAVRSRTQEGRYMFTSIRINAPRIFEDTPDGPFSYLDLLDRAESQGRLFGLVHEGDWHHISTPSDLERVRGAFETQKKTA